MSLFTPGADPDSRHDGALLVAAFCEDIAAVRSVLVKRKGT